MNLFLPAIVCQIFAIAFFWVAIENRTKAVKTSDSALHPAPGDVYNQASRLNTAEPALLTKTVIDVKDGFVKYQAHYVAPMNMSGTNVATLDQFLFDSVRVLPDKNPFNTPEPEKKP